jgi:hypothetical protein
MNLKLRKFDPSQMGDNRVAVFIGKRGTGKTTLVTDILWHKRGVPVGVVMSGTEEGNGHYGNFVPDSFIYPDFDKDVVEKVIGRQRKLASKKDIDNRVFMLLDDCMYDKRILKEKCIRSLFFNGRHWNIFLMITMQYCMDMGPDLRSNVDYIFILRDNIINVREKVYKSFFGVFPSFDVFCQVMDACTENYECLVLDNTSTSNRIEDCVFWYKAKIRSPFRVGSDRFWNFHQMAYKAANEDDEDLGGALLEKEVRKRKHGYTINVHKLSDQA